MAIKHQSVLKQIKNQKQAVKDVLSRFGAKIDSDMKLLAHIYFEHSIKYWKLNPNNISIMLFMSHFANKVFGNPSTTVRARREVEKEHPEFNFTKKAPIGEFKVEDRVKNQLFNCSQCRDSDLKLIMSLWLDDCRYASLDPNKHRAVEFLKLMNQNNVTNPISIIRARRKITKEFPLLKGSTDKQRKEEAKDVRNHYGKNK